MRYKNAESALGVDKRHSMLLEVLFFAETYSRDKFGIIPVITASARTHATSIEYYADKVINRATGKPYTASEVPYSTHETEAPDGTVVPLRATDLRAKIYTRVQRNELVKAINDKFQYDPTRAEKKVAMCHTIGVGIHFHLQVHPRTRLRP